MMHESNDCEDCRIYKTHFAQRYYRAMTLESHLDTLVEYADSFESINDRQLLTPVIEAIHDAVRLRFINELSEQYPYSQTAFLLCVQYPFFSPFIFWHLTRVYSLESLTYADQKFIDELMHVTELRKICNKFKLTNPDDYAEIQRCLSVFDSILDGE